MDKFKQLPNQEINNSKNELKLIDRTKILGDLNPFVSIVFGLMKYLSLDKTNSVILEAGSNPVGDFNMGLMSPNVAYFFANHPSIIDYYQFDAFMEDAYIPYVKEQIEANQNKCNYVITNDEMLENMKKQMIFSYDSFQQKKEEVDKSGKNSIIISSNVFGSHLNFEEFIEYDFWNLKNSLQISRFCFMDFLKDEYGALVDIGFEKYFTETKGNAKLIKENIKKDFNLETEQKRGSFLEQKLQQKYSINNDYQIFDCPFEEGYSIAISNTLK